MRTVPRGASTSASLVDVDTPGGGPDDRATAARLRRVVRRAVGAWRLVLVAEGAGALHLRTRDDRRGAVASGLGALGAVSGRARSGHVARQPGGVPLLAADPVGAPGSRTVR